MRKREEQAERQEVKLFSGMHFIDFYVQTPSQEGEENLGNRVISTALHQFGVATNNLYC